MNTTIIKPGLSLCFLLILIFFQSCDHPVNKKSALGDMFMRNSRHSGNEPSASVENKPHLLWKVDTGEPVISSPVIAEGVLYIGSNNNSLYALEAATGDIIWEYQTGGAITSTPAVAKGKLMFLSSDGFFYALDKEDGKLQWKFKTGGEAKFKVKDYFNGSFKPDFWDFYLSSATVKDGRVYFGSSDANIYALDIESGEKIWSYQTGGSIHSSPALAGNYLVVGSWDSNLYCLDVNTGEVRWIFETGKDLENYIWLGIQASPSIENGIVYVGSRDANFYALDLETGEAIWTQDDFHRSWMPSSAAIGEENLYTGSSDAFSFYSLDKQTGKINYKTNTKTYTFSSPAIDEKMAYIGAANGRLYGIDLDSGKIKWEYRALGAEKDTLKIYNHAGGLDKERYKELTKGIEDMPALSSLMEKAYANAGAILSSPVISEQVIYFGSSDGHVYAITDKE